MPTDLNALEAECSRYYWFHSIDLGGYTTPGVKSADIMRIEYAQTFDGLDLKGRTVLDIGAWNGAFTLEAFRRGAREVTALDHVTWNAPGLHSGRATFDIVMREAGVAPHTVNLDLDQRALDLSGLGRFDVVVFLGVFYHLKDPIAAVREIASLVSEVLVLETYIETSLPPEPPAMMFYPNTELVGDPSNWWGPNIACVKALLEMCGFSRIEINQGAAYNRFVFRAFRD